MRRALADLSAKADLDRSDQLALDPADFDPSYARPATRRNIPAFKLQGRCGDLIVVQVRGSSNSGERMQATLRSLGLGKPGKASLRWSDNAATVGQLQAVRHLVAVARMSNPCYKEWITEGFESQQYGTPSRPGEVWRDSVGRYIGYHGDLTSVSLYMSTAASFAESLVALQRCGMEPDPAANTAWLSWRDERGESDSGTGQFLSLMAGLDSGRVRRASLPIKTVGRVAPETLTMTMLWQAELQRFRDFDRVAHEIGFLAARKSAAKLSELRGVLAELASRDACPVSMEFRSDGGKRIEVAI